MKRSTIFLVISIVAITLLIAGCTSTPTTQTKASEPTKAPVAPAAQPTVAPAQKVDFPSKGKAVTLIIPYAPGGNTDVGGRILAAVLEKQLGVPVEVVNKPGASTQVGTTELMRAKPDGYTIGIIANPTTLSTYLDTSFKAIYARKDFRPLANYLSEPAILAVKSDSLFKGVKEVVEAAKAKPKSIKISDGGLKGSAHLSGLGFAKVAGVEFTYVHFDGTGPAMTALLGGHVDGLIGHGGSLLSQYKNGAIRVLGIMDEQESPYYPGVKTFKAQGYPISAAISFGICAPADTPKGIADILHDAIKKSIETDDLKKRIADAGLTLAYMNPEKYAAFWAEEEPRVKERLELAGKATN